MNSLSWLQYFENNRLERTEPAWHLPTPLEPHARKAIARSLSHFQLGESGDGAFLFKQADTQSPHHPNYRRALALFIAEEKEHARWLELLVRRFGGALVRRHWTHFLFRQVRRAFGLTFEIQVLVIAEIVGAAYYRLFHRRTCDPALEEVCERVLRDEAQHIAFHAEWLAEFQSRFLPLERGMWALQFQMLFVVAAQVAWIDHRGALRIVGASRHEFFREARVECIRFLARLTPPAAAAATPRASGFATDAAGQ